MIKTIKIVPFGNQMRYFKIRIQNFLTDQKTSNNSKIRTKMF